MNRKLVGSTSIALALAAWPASRTRRRPAPAAAARAHAHRQRRHLQPVHLPRHLADRRQARAPGRLRLRALERLLRRHLGVERQLARGLRALHPQLEPRVGLLRRLQGELRRQRLLLRRRHDLLLLPRATENSGVANADTWEVYAGVGWKWASAKFSYNLDGLLRRHSPPVRTPTAPGTSTSRPRYPLGDTGVTLIAHYGILDVRKDGSGNVRRRATTTGSSARRTTVPTACSRALEIGAYYSDNNANGGFYTDLTG